MTSDDAGSPRWLRLRDEALRIWRVDPGAGTAYNPHTGLTVRFGVPPCTDPEACALRGRELVLKSGLMISDAKLKVLARSAASAIREALGEGDPDAGPPTNEA